MLGKCCTQYVNKFENSAVATGLEKFSFHSNPKKGDAKAETPVLWPPHAKSRLIGKDSDAGRDWGQEEKGTTEDEVARWHH